MLAELDGPVNDDHPDVSRSHESEWCLSAFPSGLLIWEDVEEDDEPRHLADVRRALTSLSKVVDRRWRAIPVPLPDRRSLGAMANGALNRLVSQRNEVLAAAERRGARNVRVFGSVARGDDEATSDVDLLVDLDDGVSVIGLAVSSAS